MLRYGIPGLLSIVNTRSFQTLYPNSKSLPNLYIPNHISAYGGIRYRGLLDIFAYRRIKGVSNTETHGYPHSETGAKRRGIKKYIPITPNTDMQDTRFVRYQDIGFGICGLVSAL